MSANHLEIPPILTRNVAIAAELLEIADINHEFLKLLLHPDAQPQNSVLGLHSGILEGLRGLSQDQLNTVSAAPLLLAHISCPPGRAISDGVADHEMLFARASACWQRELQGFVDRLLTCMWQRARRETGTATLCMGLDAQARYRLAQLSFTALSGYSRHAAASLKAHLAEHPNFWPDLIGSAHSSDPLRKVVSQLSVIQLSVVRQPGSTDENRRLAALPTW